jgi:hypothetical protein
MGTEAIHSPLCGILSCRDDIFFPPAVLNKKCSDFPHARKRLSKTTDIKKAGQFPDPLFCRF